VGAGGRGEEYLDFLEDTVLPLIAKHFRVETARPNVGIMGSSLGGLISCYAGEWVSRSLFVWWPAWVRSLVSLGRFCFGALIAHWQGR
jgi:hypothetical protein